MKIPRVALACCCWAAFAAFMTALVLSSSSFSIGGSGESGQQLRSVVLGGGGGGHRARGGGTVGPLFASSGHWPPPAAMAGDGASTLAACTREQRALLSASPGDFTDERAFIRAMDLLFSLEGRQRTPLGNRSHPLRLVTLGHTWDSLLGRYPHLGRGFQALDRILFVEAHPATLSSLHRQSGGDRWAGDTRVHIHAAVPWSADLPSVTVRHVRGEKEGSPVRVEAGAPPTGGEDGVPAPVRAVRLDTLLPAEEGQGVDVLLVGDSAGQEPHALAGARGVLRRTRVALFVCHPTLWSEEEWVAVLDTMQSAGHTAVLLGLKRNLVLTPELVGDVRTALGQKDARAFCMAVQTGSREWALSRDAGFSLELLLASRRAVQRGDTPDSARTGVNGSPCVPVVAGRIEAGGGPVQVL